MGKFDSILEASIVPDWAAYYISYKELVQCINEINANASQAWENQMAGADMVSLKDMVQGEVKDPSLSLAEVVQQRKIKYVPTALETKFAQRVQSDLERANGLFASKNVQVRVEAEGIENPSFNDVLELYGGVTKLRKFSEINLLALKDIAQRYSKTGRCPAGYLDDFLQSLDRQPLADPSQDLNDTVDVLLDLKVQLTTQVVAAREELKEALDKALPAFLFEEGQRVRERELTAPGPSSSLSSASQATMFALVFILVGIFADYLFNSWEIEEATAAAASSAAE